MDAIALLEADHKEVDKLFEQFENAEGVSDKKAIVNAICIALKVHARVEEDLFYPAAYKALGKGSLIQEAMVEHASAKDLIAQIETGFPGEPLFDARVTVLGEYVCHHVEEEEDEIFPLFRKSRIDLNQLGQQMALRKDQLLLGLTVSNPLVAVD